MTVFEPSNQYWAKTHHVENLPEPLINHNTYSSDIALTSIVKTLAPNLNTDDLNVLGEICGSENVVELGFQANVVKPELHTHDRYGHRVDEIRFHPAYHELMTLSMKHGIHSSHWESVASDRNLERAVKSYMMCQVEAGHGCPITMTSAAIASLKHQPELYDIWAPKILNRTYDPRNIPHFQKDSVTIGMAMTEKQGGSDVRRNSTRAFPIDGNTDGLYELVGHKYFVSAPMCDAFLVLAQTTSGVSCFLVPRWKDDGTKNPIQIQKLKNKMGNVSNASSETELRGAQGWLLGQEGKGVATILDMVAMTRFDCMIGSSAGMRQAVAQATHHCASRAAFGALLNKQPLMQNVLADLILESEAALALTLRMARALDRMDEAQDEAALMRIGTAVGKYWICKRTPGHAYEAMECIGGMGVMEDTIMPRLFRESPVNAIWEGSGNVQCLDMIRAMQRAPESVDALLRELS
ncbi:DNA alkylation response protein, partial [Oleiphilus sp. HI0065]